MAEAALGASIVVPTPDGKKIKVKVPAGTQDGKVLTIKGKGAPDPVSYTHLAARGRLLFR